MRRAFVERISISLCVACIFAVLLFSGCAATSTSPNSAVNPSPDPSAISVSVSPTTATVTAGQQQAFTATVQNDSQNEGVTWALSGTGCSGSACGTLSAMSSASGAGITYTAPATVPAPPSVTLTATSVSDGTKSAAAMLTIAAKPAAIAVTLSPTTANVAVGGTQAFTATVQNDSQNKGVTWSLAGTGCSGNMCGTLSAMSSASGAAITYTAPGNLPAPPTVTLTATSVSDGTKSAAATITVNALPPAVSVGVSPTTASVAGNDTQSFTATVQNDTQNEGVTWALSGAGCSGAACGTLSATASGSGTAITYTSPGTVPAPPTVTLTATSVANGAKSATATITVTPVGSISVHITPKRSGIPVTQTLNFTATVMHDVGNAGVAWSVAGSNCTGNSCGTFSNVASPSTSATYNAPSTAGVYTITATSVANNAVSASATFGVTDLGGIFTFHNDPSDLFRNGVNSQEYALTTASVTPGTFGKLFSCPVDGAVYTQPLWVPGLNINGAAHNVIFAATQHDSLYALDADANPCVQLWHVNLLDSGHGGTSGETPVPSGPTGYLVGQGDGDITPEVGVTGTPVIDPSTNTLYVVSKSVIASGPTFFQRLHAIDLATGNEKFGAPVAISATVSGNAPDSVSGKVAFNPRTQNQRPGLALVNGVVYIAWASHEDTNPWHGWLIGYRVTNGTLAQASVFNTTPNTVNGATYARGGIWMSGGAPAADSANNLYLITGNGTFDGIANFGDSLLKISTSSGLSLTDWFTPSDQAFLDSDDLDFGSGGAVVLVDVPLSPVPHLLLGGGKQGSGKPGEIFVLNRDALGHFNSADNQVVQKFSTNNQIFSTPAFWNNTLYVVPMGGNLMSYAFNSSSGLFNATPTQSTVPSGGFGFPGATPSVSASGGTNGIVWILDDSQYCTPQSPGCGPTVLHAYDATNVGSELWNSGSTAGNAVKFTVPTVANGKVYVGTRGSDTVNGGTGELDVYGLLPN